MSRLPIRVRLTAAFAVAMVIVLVGAGLFVYLRLKSDLDESVTAGLQTRAAAVAASGASVRGSAGDAEEGFAQVLDADGRVLDSAGGQREPRSARPSASGLQRGGELLVERRVPGIEGTTRVLARARAGPEACGGRAIARRPRRDPGRASSLRLSSEGRSRCCWPRCSATCWPPPALRPVEAMRRRAGEISLGNEQERLPLPPARDEIATPGGDAQRDARPPAPVLRARAALRGRRQPRAAHPGGGDQGRARGCPASRPARPAGARSAGGRRGGMRRPGSAGRGSARGGSQRRRRAAGTAREPAG